MEAREILLYWSLKYLGNWDHIYSALQTKEEFDEKEAKELIKKVKSDFFTFLDEDYPESLKDMYKPPFVLYYHGDISLISDTHNKLAVVGARKCTTYGEETTKKFVEELCKDFVIVSGLAYGIDAAAHRSSIENGGKTVAVLGNGINFCYIEDNKDIYEECKKSHLVISEYPDLVEPLPCHFPVRNRIIAGLCETLLVTEGKVASGTQVTALLMTRKNGNVCCIPTRIGEDSICNRLISEGAYLVETPEDVYDVANVVKKKPIFEK